VNEKRQTVVPNIYAMNGFKTLKSESQIIHKLIEMTINKIDIDEDGNLKLKN
jgi:hypothetical protein